jgi:hypothetical protein
MRPSSRIDRKFRNPCPGHPAGSRRDPAVDERDAVGVAGVPAELVVGRLDDHPGCTCRHDERRDAVVGARRHGHDRGDVGPAVGDERLRAVQHPLVTVEHRPGARRAGIGAAVGFGEPERAERPSGDEIRKPLVALVVRSEAEDRVRAEPDTGRQGDAHRLVDAAQLLDGDTQRREVAASAAPPLGEHDAEQTQITHRLDHVDREVARHGPTPRRTGRFGSRRTRGRSPAAVRGRRSIPSSSESTLVAARCATPLPNVTEWLGTPWHSRSVR